VLVIFVAIERTIRLLQVSVRSVLV